jgi:hypothetical protein
MVNSLCSQDDRTENEVADGIAIRICQDGADVPRRRLWAQATEAEWQDP